MHPNGDVTGKRTASVDTQGVNPVNRMALLDDDISPS